MLTDVNNLTTSVKMAVTVAPKDVNEFLTQQKNIPDKDLATEWAQLEELYNHK